ncbi:MAG: sugar MFS transporter [Steroidobacteraceae bacterium]
MSNHTPRSRSLFIVWLVFLIFFVISFVTNILGPLVPDIIRDFHVSEGMAGTLALAFFIAYGVMSIPAGFLVERWGEKRLMVTSFVLCTAGALGFALTPTYPIAIVSLFAIGAGFAALQVAINPLLRVAGGEEHFAYYSAFAQLVFGAASFISPLVFTYLIGHLQPGIAHGAAVGLLARLTPPAMPWVSMYWLFALATAIMIVVVAVIRLPNVERTADESAGTLSMYRELLRNRVTVLYFLMIFAYVGCEQGTSVWMSRFLGTYHGFNPEVQGASAVAYFWGLMTIGCFIGMLLLKIFDSRRVLIGFASGAIAMLTLALFGPAHVSLYAFPAVGLFASIMWPTIVSLALNSVPSHHGPFAGILCTGIMGGAIVPFLIGQLADHIGLRNGMLLLYVTFGCVLSVGFWARPLINNALIGERRSAAT